MATSMNNNEDEILKEFAYDILVSQCIWVREDAIRELRLVSEVSIEDATRVVDEVYGGLLRRMHVDDLQEASTAAFQYIDACGKLVKWGLVSGSMVVDQVAERTGTPKALAWAVVVAVQNAGCGSLDLKKNPYSQNI